MVGPEFILDIDQEAYEQAGSKFITFPPGAKKGDVQYRKIECGMLDWDTPQKSMKIPVVITEEGVDFNKEEKISFGVDAKGIWKGKGIYKNITGHDMPFKKGSDSKMHPVINPTEINGKEAIGQWVMTEGKKGGVGDLVLYPKLMEILPKDFKPETAKDIV